MFTELNIELLEVKENLRKKNKYEEHIARLKTYLQEEKLKKYKLENQLQKEKEDAARLEGFSLTNIFYTITGKKLERLDKEQQEVLAAKLKYTEAIETIKDVEKEINEFNELLSAVSNAEKNYEEIIRKKENIIRSSNSIWSVKFITLADNETDLASNLKEYEEAVYAGKIAEDSLDQALKSLDSAKNWSTFDMFGGGVVSTHMKHSRLDDAKKEIHQAQYHLRRFQEELVDIQNHFHSNLEIGGMLTFADYFFDGLIVDWMVHGKINDSYNQTERTKSDVSILLSSLREKKNSLKEELTAVQREKKVLLETSN